MALRCILVDDDPLSLLGLEKLCERTEGLELVGTFGGVASAVAFLEKEEVDLIFLDIEMPEENGLTLLDRLTCQPQVVVVSGRTDFAYEAFEYAVADYLKKPISLPRFLRAVEKVRLQLHQNQSYRDAARDIYIRQEGKLIRLAFSDILFFETVGDYVRIKTRDGSFLIHHTIKAIDEKIRDPRFLKVHRSYIVNLDMVVEVGEHSLAIDLFNIPISRANRPVLLNRLNIL